MLNKEFILPTTIEPKYLELISRRAGAKCLQYFIKNYNKEGEESLGQFVRWKDRKNPKNENPLLYKKGNMKSHFNLKVNKNGFVISNAMPYFKYHQSGTEHIPQRMMLYQNYITDKIITDEIDFVIGQMLGFK